MDSVGAVKRTLATNSYLRTGSGSPISKVAYGNGNYIQYGYDRYDRETSKNAETGVLSTSTYNAKGQLARLNDLAAGVTQNYSYDLLGRLINTRNSGANSDYSRYTYDNMNRMTDNYTTVNGYVIGNGYVYGSDSLISEAWQGSYCTNYSYDNLNRVTSAALKNSGDSRTNQKVNYTFAPGANGSSTAMVAGMEYLRNDVSDGSISYTYDDGGNIRTITENGKTITYSYDGLNQLVREDNERDGKSYTYTYDNGGNITAKSEYAYTTGTLGAPASTISYDYDAADWKDLMTSYNGQTITYDTIGNPLTYRDGMTMTWQRGRQLASLQKGSTAVNYVYGEDGLRTKKTVGGAATNYHWNDLDQLVEQDGANGTLVFYHDDKGDTGVIVYNGTSYTLRKNAQSDVTAILDIANNIVAKYTYDAWGKVLSVTDANGNAITDPNHIANINPIRYRGYYYDTETGLYYLNSRYYDPETYRMLNGDSVNTTIEQNDSLFSTNLFAYCSNNPVNYADDDGQWGLPTWAKIAIGVAGIAAAVAVTVATGGAAAPALFAAVKIVAISVASSAAIGGVVGYATGGKAGLKKGLISGAIDGFMWGGIGAGVSAAAKAYKALKVAKTISGACFVAGTLIAAKDGYKPIEQIKIGDLVYSENPETGEKGVKQVVQTFERQTNEFVHIRVDGQSITTTPDHPFYVPQKGWIKAIELRAGDKLVLQSGKIVIIEQVQHEMLETPATVYNFEVEDYHTYYVSKASVLVHNNCGGMNNLRTLQTTTVKGYKISMDLERGGSGLTNIHLKIGNTKYFYNGKQFINSAGKQIPKALKGSKIISKALQKALDAMKRGW